MINLFEECFLDNIPALKELKQNHKNVIAVIRSEQIIITEKDNGFFNAKIKMISLPGSNKVINFSINENEFLAKYPTIKLKGR